MSNKSVERIERTLRETEVVAATGIILSSLEYLCQPQVFEKKGGLLSWDVGRTRLRSTAHRRADFLDAAFNPPGIHALVALRLTAAVLSAVPGTSSRVRATAASYLAVTNVAMHVRNSYGGDGSDHMNVLVHSALSVARWFPNDKRVQEITTLFLAAQVCLSYAAAGAAKLISPYWRDGTAMSGIFRTRTYGHRLAHNLLAKYPALAKVGGWGVIAGELSFPLVLVANKPIAKALLATGTAFHIGNAVFMGLNRFVWGFGAGYPSIGYHARALSKAAVK
ncbi:hypothetical protein [Amycolatopsis sp. H20-H5]|uniref:hypothetical protein n=1 Tax=Amycolatopsis sp. H20-H5 TaxID=3046309 RepID=UPI002DB93BB2|nr:hypothetical protein [Amycolatopsis sp. H20-H5]MEC3975491.1 hypothetical protein [Amycolatopsis sp. H20-H5]